MMDQGIVAAAMAIFQPSQPSETFPLFPFFTLEIRELIWSFASPGPRVIRVKCRASVEDTTQSGAHSIPPKLRIIALIPAILQCTSESRRIAARTYKLCFRHFLRPGHRGIYFDCDKDILYFKYASDQAGFFDNAPVEAVSGLHNNLKHLMLCTAGKGAASDRDVVDFSRLETLTLCLPDKEMVLHSQVKQLYGTETEFKQCMQYYQANGYRVTRVRVLSKKRMIADAKVDSVKIFFKHGPTAKERRKVAETVRKGSRKVKQLVKSVKKILSGIF